MSSHLLKAAILAGTVLVLTSGCSGGGADRTVAVGSHDYGFSGIEEFQGRAGEAVEFALTNTGRADHEFEVFGPDGKAVGEVGPTSEGRTRKATLRLSKTGTYRFVCGVSDHEARGMTGTFEVR